MCRLGFGFGEHGQLASIHFYWALIVNGFIICAWNKAPYYFEID